MDTKTRRATIADRLQVEGEAAIVELAAFFGTSEMTIRRDLERLEQAGLARRARGGAISVQSRSFEPPILQRASHMAEDKRRIGAAAAALLNENETVVLDVGTTIHEMAKAIADDFAVTVVTSSLLIATELGAKSSVRTIVTGGVVRVDEMSLVGPRAESSFADLNCDTVFLGVAGVSDIKGLTEYNLDDANVKQIAIDSGRRVVVLADASKIGRVAFVTIAPISVVDLLITTAPPDNLVIRRLKDQGLEIMHVEPFNKEQE
jgi:DeoR/GlpR family transcriptional regulator of sugar metabolism